MAGWDTIVNGLERRHGDNGNSPLPARCLSVWHAYNQIFYYGEPAHG